MYKRHLVGIDIGTSGCKSIIINEEGNVISSETAEYPLHLPQPGWTEQDPDDWWEGTVKSIRKAIQKIKIDPKSILGIGLSGQMNGMVALDRDTKVLRRAILWSDQRTVKQCEEIVEAAGGEDNLLEYINNRMLSAQTAGKILWLRENEPHLYEKVRLILNPKDYIQYLLTGESATEVSDAPGTGLFDIKNRCWCDELISALKMPKEFFPNNINSLSLKMGIYMTSQVLTISLSFLIFPSLRPRHRQISTKAVLPVS